MTTTHLASVGSSALPLARLRRVTDYIREHAGYARLFLRSRLATYVGRVPELA